MIIFQRFAHKFIPVIQKTLYGFDYLIFDGAMPKGIFTDKYSPFLLKKRS